MDFPQLWQAGIVFEVDSLINEVLGMILAIVQYKLDASTKLKSSRLLSPSLKDNSGT